MAEPFDVSLWRSRVAAWWQEAAGDLPGIMGRLGVRTAYGLLAASAWLPLLAAYGQDPGQAVTALVGVLGGVGTNLLSNLVQGVYDRSAAPRQAEQEIAEEPGLRADLGYLNPKIGGAATLASYGVRNAADRPIPKIHADAIAAVPHSHRQFLESRPTLHQAGTCAFVHAGIRPGIALADQTETDLVWIREPFLSTTESHGPLIVHGHTALDRATHYGNRLNLDSGAAYGGPLSAVVIEGHEAALLTPNGRHKLHPERA